MQGRCANMKNKVSFSDVLNHYSIDEKEVYIFALKHDLLLEYSIAKGEGDSFRNEIRRNWRKFLDEYEYDDIVIRYVEQRLLYTKLAFGRSFNLIRRDDFLVSLLIAVNVKLQIVYTNDNLLSSLRYLVINNMNLNHLPVSQNDVAKEVKWRISRYFGTDEISISQDIKETTLPYKQELQFLNDFISEELEERFDSHALTENVTENEDNQLVNLKRQFDVVVKNKNEEIDILKGTLKSSKSSSQQDLIYASRQYDKAIENLIIGLTETKFGNVLDKLYDYHMNPKQDEVDNILTNLFFVLTTFGIEVYQGELIQSKVELNKEDLGKVYRVIDGSLANSQGEAIVSYPGWKLRDKVIVLPGIIIL